MEQTVGSKLRHLRESRGFTRGELSLKADISENTIISQEKRASRRLSVEMLTKYANAYGLTLAQLRSEIGLPPGREEEFIKIPINEEYPVKAGKLTDLTTSSCLVLPAAKYAGRRLEAFRVKGICMEPQILDGSVLLIDRDMIPQPNQIILCMIDDDLHIGHYRVEDGKAFLENGHGRHDLSRCRNAAVVISAINEFV